MIEIHDILRNYGLNKTYAVDAIKGGTTVKAWALRNDDSDLILRELDSIERAVREQVVLRHLAEKRFAYSPKLIETTNGEGFVEYAGKYYQIQTRCRGSMPSTQDLEIPTKLGELVVKLGEALASCPSVQMPDDRFDLRITSPKALDNWELYDLSLDKSEVESEIEKCLNINKESKSVIHGDFGLWNTLYDGEHMHIIDFGEAGVGDPYFDIASAIGSLLNHSEAENHKYVYNGFITECNKHMHVDKARLGQQLDLWYWRGIAQVAVTPFINDELRPKIMNKFIAALQWVRRMLR